MHYLVSSRDFYQSYFFLFINGDFFFTGSVKYKKDFTSKRVSNELSNEEHALQNLGRIQFSFIDIFMFLDLLFS